MRTTSSYLNTGNTPNTGDIPRILNNTLADNMTWGLEEVNQSLRYLTTKFYFDERTYTVPGGTVSGTQFYNLPPQVKKLINLTVTIGSVLWQPKECPSREYWDYLNTISFQQDFPSFFFVYNGQVGIFPIPSSSGNTITMNYKTRIIDLSMQDVTGTVNITTNTTTVTAAAGTPFLKWMANAWIRVVYSSTDSANGDNQWYQIASVTSTTVLVLKNQYTGATVTAGSFTIGETPMLPEDYQDLPLWRMAIIYYTTRFPDPARAQLYQELWDRGYKELNDEFGSKTQSVGLQDTTTQTINPNLFQKSISQV